MKEIKKLKERVTLLEDLTNAQQELIVIFKETIDTVDSADNAVATVMDPWDESIKGKDLHDIRMIHMDREMELEHEIDGYFDKLEGKEPEKTE